MTELLEFLNAAGGVGVWVLVGVVWRFHDRLNEISHDIKQHVAVDEVIHRRTDARLELLETQ